MPNFKELNLIKSIPTTVSRNTLQQLKTAGSQARPVDTAPNPVASSGTVVAPAHVQNVAAKTVRASDISTQVIVTFKRDSQDYNFVEAKVFVTGYNGNPSPVQVAAGQSPVQFFLNNTGEAVTVTVQASGNLSPAAMSTAPTTTLKLDKTPLATTPTPGGNGTASSATFQTNSVDNADQTLLNLESTDSSLSLTNTGGAVDFVVPFNIYNLARMLTSLHGWGVDAAAATIVGIADNPAAAIGTETIQAPTSTEGPYGRIVSQAFANGQGVKYSNNNRGITRGALKFWKARMQISALTPGVIWYAGIDNINPGTTLLVATPTTEKMCMFRYVTGETNWTFATGDGSTATITDLGVAADTNWHDFLISFRSGAVDVYIDHVLVSTITLTLPAAGDILSSVVSLQANAKNNHFQYVWWAF